MGVSGTIEYLSDLVSSAAGGYRLKKKKKKPEQTVDVKIKMDCDGCERKVKNALKSLSGVKKVEINRKISKASVTGYVDQAKVLKAAKSTGKKVEIWPYVPYTLVKQPYDPKAYDKKAPAGHVRNVEFSANVENIVPVYDPYTNLFSDENPNACSIM
ncbi:hypothetical protein MLD38_035644 [Melastoma candidum]|uniref:Uncharacterized protein n=1 Tax=Melastoma candidum TaxID=119954 RepID=A0ACB9LHG7_9MYRT|nr:hypothetical protein MLD38_035644 [Melastoma candidum]